MAAKTKKRVVAKKDVVEKSVVDSSALNTEVPAWMDEKKEQKKDDVMMDDDALDPAEEKLLDWILKVIVGFILIWLTVSIVLVILGYFGVWGK